MLTLAASRFKNDFPPGSSESNMEGLQLLLHEVGPFNTLLLELMSGVVDTHDQIEIEIYDALMEPYMLSLSCCKNLQEIYSDFKTIDNKLNQFILRSDEKTRDEKELLRTRSVEPKILTVGNG